MSAIGELVGEDVIYFDENTLGAPEGLEVLHRQGRTYERHAPGFGEVRPTPTPGGGNNYWTLPIPAREMQMNPNMEQNEGWK